MISGFPAYSMARIRTAIVRQIGLTHHTKAEHAVNLGLKCSLRNL
jgi:hypothetical protein